MIGLLSLVNAENYGAVLQSFALCEFINENFDEAEIIDFTPDFIVGRYRIFCIKKDNFRVFLKSLFYNIRIFPIVFLKKFRFYMFRKKYLKMSKKKYFGKDLGDDYDKYIVGSDQIWNLELTNYDETFFVPFCEKGSKYSYAASIGVNYVDDKMEKILKKYLVEFEKISVREKTAVDLLRDICDKIQIEQHIDPTFLLNKEWWIKYSKRKRIIKEKYVLIYTFTEFNRALEIARKTGYKIYSIHNSYRGTLEDVRSVPGVGPSEFLSLIKDAEYIVTDSFHGMVFSIIFNKQFTVIPYKGTESRMTDLLEDLSLSSRVYAETFDVKENIDYKIINILINKKIEEAKSYLRSVVRK